MKINKQNVLWDKYWIYSVFTIVNELDNWGYYLVPHETITDFPSWIGLRDLWYEEVMSYDMSICENICFKRNPVFMRNENICPLYWWGDHARSMLVPRQAECWGLARKAVSHLIEELRTYKKQCWAVKRHEVVSQNKCSLRDFRLNKKWLMLSQDLTGI